MSLFKGSIRPPTIWSDEAIERYLSEIWAHVEPDPLFRRRLRGEVVNRHVAVREGHREAQAARRQMGRLGRACLYASFSLAVTVSTTLAASQEAIPGDALYPLKRDIEALRLRVLPAHLHDDLAAYVLSERIGEMSRLAEAGQLDRLAVAAGEVEDAYAEVIELGGSALTNVSLEARLAALDALLEALPPEARAAVGESLDDLQGAGNNGGAHNDGSNPNATTNNGGGNNDGSSGNAQGEPAASAQPRTPGSGPGTPAGGSGPGAEPGSGSSGGSTAPDDRGGDLPPARSDTPEHSPKPTPKPKSGE